MTSATFCSRFVPRNTSNQEVHCWFNAWQTCSSVTSRFFPPQPFGLARCKRYRHQTQDQVSHQTDVTPPLEVAEADFPFARAKTMLYVPATETHTQQMTQPHPGLCRGYEVLLLGGRSFASTEQLVSEPVTARDPDPSRLGLPFRVSFRLVVQAETLPRLAVEHRAIPYQFVGPMARLFPPRPAAETTQRLGHLTDVTQVTFLQALQEARF